MNSHIYPGITGNNKGFGNGDSGRKSVPIPDPFFYGWSMEAIDDVLKTQDEFYHVRDECTNSLDWYSRVEEARSKYLAALGRLQDAFKLTPNEVVHINYGGKLYQFEADATGLFWDITPDRTIYVSSIK